MGEQKGDNQSLIRAVQKESSERPVIGGSGQSSRQVELDNELKTDATKHAKEQFFAGEISVEQFEKKKH